MLLLVVSDDRSLDRGENQATNLFGATVYIWLKIKKGEADENGLYELVAATEDTVNLPSSVAGCETDGMRESMAALQTALR